jgi:hypothetical protein
MGIVRYIRKCLAEADSCADEMAKVALANRGAAARALPLPRRHCGGGVRP